MEVKEDFPQHIFVSQTFSRFAEENAALISAVAADDAIAVTTLLNAFPEAILWLNPLKNQSILNEACRLDAAATAAAILAHLKARRDGKLTRCVVNFIGDSGWTPLMNACHHGNLGLARELVMLGADVNAQNNQCWSPLTVSAAGGFLDVAEYLLTLPRLDLKARVAEGRDACLYFFLFDQRPLVIGTFRKVDVCFFFFIQRTNTE